MNKLLKNIFSSVFIIVIALFVLYFIYEDTQFEKQKIYTVVKVYDGDTIKLSNDKKIRFIGIDAPEMNYDTKNPECYAKESKEYLKNTLLGKQVILELDKQKTDKYGRILAYVYTKDKKTFINKSLVENGFAIEKTYPPNIRYQDILKQAEEIAREQLRGLWSKCYFR